MQFYIIEFFNGILGATAKIIFLYYSRKANQTVDSERMLRRCIYIEPKFIPAYIELARLRGPQDRNVGSLLKAIVQINPMDPNYITIYGYWLLNKGI